MKHCIALVLCQQIRPRRERVLHLYIATSKLMLGWVLAIRLIRIVLYSVGVMSLYDVICPLLFVTA